MATRDACIVAKEERMATREACIVVKEERRRSES